MQKLLRNLIRPVLMSLVLLVFTLATAYAAVGGGGGGMDSGGGSGLHYRLEKAKILAMEVFSLIQPEDLAHANQDPRVAEFYKTYRNELLVEVITSPIVLKPAAEVYILQGTEKVFKSMTTQLTKGTPIHVNDSLQTQDLPELIANLIHEYGHHFGVAQDDDAFLDSFSTALVQRAIEKSEDFRRKVKPCLTGDEVLSMMVGTWVGEVSFIPSLAPWNTELTIFADGSYADKSYCTDGREYCPTTFYYGTPYPDPDKKIRMNNTCGVMSGRLYVVWEVSKTVGPFELRSVNISLDRNEMEIEAYHFKPLFPLMYKLRRKK